MKKLLMSVALAGLCSVGTSLAENIPAKINMPGKVWSGYLIGRDTKDANLLEFKTSLNKQAILIGANTIDSIEFKVSIDHELINSQLDAREFQSLIEVLEKALTPYALYQDVSSNLTEYNYLLVKLYYWTEQYDKAIDMAEVISKVVLDEQIKAGCLVFRSLAMIDSGRSDEALKMLEENGADEDAAETIYIRAKVAQQAGEFTNALELAARIVAFYSQDQNWMPPAEYLCAELYKAEGFYDSSAQCIQQVMTLYRDTPEYDKAKALLVEVEALRAAQPQPAEDVENQ